MTRTRSAGLRQTARAPAAGRAQASPALRRRALCAGLMLAGQRSGRVGLGCVASLPILLAAGLLGCDAALAQARVPVNALPSTPTAPKTNAGAPNTYAVKGNTLTITQTAPASIVNWQSFDIGSQSKVTIAQPGATSVLLNNVSGGAYLNQTTIDGMLSANGRVYIYNPNGIIFGKTGVVNVGTLVASTLKFDEARVIGGFLQPGASPLLGVDPAFAGGKAGAIVVDGDGTAHAAITSANGGLILLAAPKVTNNGLLRSPDGQVMLAAGSKVYLAAPQVSQTGTSMRGLLVEVSNDAAVGATATGGSVALGSTTRGDGTVENGSNGTIDVRHGNATMIGYAVNQKGIVSASTSVNLNGSIYLSARDQAIRPDANSPYIASRSGQLVLGEGSLTQILPDTGDGATIPPASTFNKSEVRLDGAAIVMQKNARIVAPGGNVTLSARRLQDPANPVAAVADPATDTSRVDLAAGSSIDVAGSTSVADVLDASGRVTRPGTQLAMESNVITVDLRGAELADNVVLKTSPLYGTKVRIDIRKGTGAANVAGYLNLVEHGLTELNAAGGTVNIAADGAIISRGGSRINVDGGYVDYKPGYVNTTKLRLNDALVDIGAAKTNVAYTAAVDLANGADSFEAGYRQGGSAGSIRFSAPILVLQGALSGQATAGSHQRDLAAAGYPQGGQLQIGNATADYVNPQTGKANVALADQFGYRGRVVLGATNAAVAPQTGAPFDLNNADLRLLSSRLDLDTGALTRAGFNRLLALTSGSIEVDAPLTLAAGGRLWLGAGQGTLAGADGNLAPGGNITINAPVRIAGGAITATASGSLQVADGGVLDVAGRWTNDRGPGAPVDAAGNATGAAVVRGGTISLAADQLGLGNGVALDVSAGAWRNGKATTTLGSAGAISLQATPVNALLASTAQLRLGSGLTLSGYGFGSGGTLKMVARNVNIGAASAADPADLLLQPAFFQRGGFTGYDIAGRLNFAIETDAVVTPQAQSWQLGGGAARRASGAMSGVAAPALLALAGAGSTRPATSVSFTALGQGDAHSGELTVNEGAQLLMDPGANMKLFAAAQLTTLGTLSAPGGNILLNLTATADSPFDPSRSIWFGPNARVLATGTAQRMTINGDGIASGDMLDGGTIRIGTMRDGVLGAATGFVVAEPGALFNVGGTSVSNVRLKSGAVVAPAQDVAGAGGSIEIRAREGLLFDGLLKGGAGGANARGGSLTVALDTEGQAGSGYPADDRVLTLSVNGPNGGGASFGGNIVPSGLLPGQAIVVERFGTAAGKTVELGWFLSGSQATSSAARHAGEGDLLRKSFADGGFARLDFKSQNVLAFGLGSAGLTLGAGDAIILDAPILRADRKPSLTGFDTPGGNTLTLNAPYIELGSADIRYQGAGAATTGNATLAANGTTVDLIGHQSLQGFGTAQLAARGDIRLIGIDASDANGAATGFATGTLSMVGNLTLTDAQTYPTTLSDFTFAVAPSAAIAAGISYPGTGRLRFAANGNRAEPVLSAAGSLNAYATEILQGGRVVAPFGAITMGNVDKAVSPILTSSVAYLDGSVTSVAGAGIVPFGTIINGSVATASQWTATLTNGTAVVIKADPATGGAVPERAPPEKSILTAAASIQENRGAVLDAAGGGSLVAYEFTPGKGGSKDVLANNTAGSKTIVFAINPNFHGSVAPVDGNFGSDGGLAPGNSVTLSAMPGLAAGRYTLLPAHYALLPGGFSISVAANAPDMQANANITLADGTMLVAGRLSESGSGAAASRATGFLISPAAVIKTKSEFALSDATTYFTAKSATAGVDAPALPVDGGNIAFIATNAAATAMALDGVIGLHAATGGRAGTAAFAAPSIRVVSEPNQNSGNSVQLVADRLSGLGASSLLIGALRDARSDGLHLSSLANEVLLSNDVQHPLSGNEIILAARNTVRLDAGAALQGSGVSGRTAQDLALDGAGALLRASGGAAVAVGRSGTNGTNGQGGTLDIGVGARVGADGSAYLDATGNLTSRGQLLMAPGTAWGFGAPVISFGSAIPVDATALAAGGLGFDTTALAAMRNLGELRFDSYAAPINLYGTVSLGSAGMRHLSFSGAGFQGFDDASAPGQYGTTFLARTVSLDGRAASAAALPGAAAGSFSILAERIEVGENAIAVRGFGDVVLAANGELRATGKAGQVVADHNLKLAAGAITTDSGAGATFRAGGDMVMTTTGGAPVPAAPPASAGRAGLLRFEGATVRSDAMIYAPSGQIALVGAGGVSVTGGLISAAGTGTIFGSTVAYAPGGSIALAGAAVDVAAAAVLDVSATGAAAGTLSVYAVGGDGRGSVRLDGSVRGAAQAGIDGMTQQQGQFALVADEAGSGRSFGELNAKLNLGGFTGSRQFEFFNGDVTLGATDRIVAQQVTIAADNGNIRIGEHAGIDASGSKGGSIELYATQAAASGNDGRILLSGQASLVARGTAQATGNAGSTGNGGRVVLGVANADGTAATAVDGGASIALAGGSIDVGGSSAQRSGSVTLRAPRVDLGDVVGNAPGGAGTVAAVVKPGSNSEVAVASLRTDIRNSAMTAIEATRVYTGATVSGAADGAGNLDAGTSGSMYADAAGFSANQAAILARLQSSAANVSLRAGIEVRAPNGNLTVSVNEFAASAADRGWNLGAWRFGGAPVALTLRAKGDLNIVGSIGDGFIKPANTALSMPDWKLGVDDSASLRLVGGADLAAANPLATIAGAGDVKLGFAGRTPGSAAPLTAGDAPVALVRTGTGRIDIAAGRDIALGMAGFFTNADGTPAIYDKANSDASYNVSLFGASIYTAGKTGAVPDPASFAAPKNLLNTHFGGDGLTLSDAAFSSNGGAIALAAGRSINGPQHLDAKGNVDPAWFYRNNDGFAGTPADPTTHPATPADPAIAGTAVALPAALPQLVNDWLFRQGRSYIDAHGETRFEILGNGSMLNTAWWSRFDYFNQGVATLGGGDVTIRAGANIANLAASTATNAYLVTPRGSLIEQGGGDLSVRAGGNIAGGAFYVQKGAASLHADGAIGAGNYAPVNLDGATPLNPVLAVGDARFDVSAGRGLTIESAYNPMLAEQSINNVVTGDNHFNPVYGVGSGQRWDVADQSQESLDYRQKYGQFSTFSTYGAASAVNLTAISGNLLLSNDAAKVAASGMNDIPDALRTSFPQLYALAPPTVRAVALAGDLRSANGFGMLAGPTAQLELLAAGNIVLGNGANGSIRMLDNDPATMSTAAAPRVLSATDFDIINGRSSGIAAHAPDGLHAGDTQPVRIIANGGDIVGDGTSANTITLAKQAQILAGRDIVDLGLAIQQNSSNAVSTVTAGRDVIDITQARGVGSEPSPVANVVTGAGRIDVSAGRNVDFGNGHGLVTRGNLDNPYLAEGGASIVISAGGATPNYGAFVGYANRIGMVSDVLATELPALTTFVSARQGKQPDASATLPAVDLWVAFRGLSEADQASFLASQPALAARLDASAARRTAALDGADKPLLDKPYLNDQYFKELVQFGGARDLAIFDRMIASLYPAAKTTAPGNIALFSSQVKTEQGGSIDLIAPTGSVYAGLTSGVAHGKESEQGIFTVNGGAIRAEVRTDFLVNQGRVFTLGGGDITLVSQYGNIDAGRGAKTASSAPPPLITIDANGNVKVDVSGSISGSGIATLKTKEGQPNSNVYPIAPRGIFDAGDAGVRSTGSVNIVANVVLNGNNISAAGAVTGAPAVVAAPALGGPSSPANAATRSDDVAKALGATDASAASNSVAVDVLGYGADDDAPNEADDEETRKRKKARAQKNQQPLPK